MSTYVLMKILESVPHRYDKGIRLLSMGQIGDYYDDLISHIKENQRVLDIGCGTGELSVRAARHGARVTGIDMNAQMLEVAREKAEAAGVQQSIEFREMGVAEMSEFKNESFDTITAGLCLSELSSDELLFTLDQAFRILIPGGRLLIADEVVPESIPNRIIHYILRLPLFILTYVWTQTTTHSIHHLQETLQSNNFIIENEKRNSIQNFTLLIARKSGNAL